MAKKTKEKAGTVPATQGGYATALIDLGVRTARLNMDSAIVAGAAPEGYNGFFLIKNEEGSLAVLASYINGDVAGAIAFASEHAAALAALTGRLAEVLDMPQAKVNPVELDVVGHPVVPIDGGDDAPVPALLDVPLASLSEGAP